MYKNFFLLQLVFLHIIKKWWLFSTKITKWNFDIHIYNENKLAQLAGLNQPFYDGLN